jgi:site-specific DNA recombinase
MTARRAAIYCRISQDRAGAGLGVERQREDCEALADRLGWSVVETFTDNDLSAYAGKARAGYRDALEAIKTGRVDGVLVWHTDRLHRSPKELEEYVELCERHKVVTQTVQAGELDLTTASGRMVARMLGAVARHESEHKSERVRRAQLQAAQAGRWLGGGRPFGWRPSDPSVQWKDTADKHRPGVVILDAVEAAAVQRCTAAVLAGESLGSQISALNTSGLRTPTGRPWSYTQLRQVLLRARNAGLSELGGEIVGRSAWPPIVAEADWWALRAVLSDESRRRSTTNRVRWLLAGIAVCGVCGAALKSATVTSNRRTGTTRAVYRCPAGYHVARACLVLDGYVSEAVVERLSLADVRAALLHDAGGGDDDLGADYAAVSAQLDELGAMYGAGEISASQLRAGTARLRTRLTEVAARVGDRIRGAAVAGIVDAADVRRAWADLEDNITRRRAILREVVKVVVHPAGRRRDFDPSLVELHWLV